jgi:hypothetical protein
VLPSSRVGKFGRIAIVVYLAIWTFVVVFSWIYWTDMSFWLKAFVVVLEMFFIPDVASIREAFDKNDRRGHS